jgi:RNA polymerase sigma-70 factor, ECF subfamily
VANPTVELERDRALLDAFRAGSSPVLERLYYAYVDDVFRLVALGFATASGTIRPELDPDEQRAIVQEVFLRAFSDQARAAYDGLRPYRPYLLTIARNLMVDRARARAADLARASAVDVDQVIATNGALPEDIEEATDQRRLREQARAYIATLEGELRTFVELRFDRDLSQAALAAELGTTRRKIRTLEARVIAGFRAFLATQRPD